MGIPQLFRYLAGAHPRAVSHVGGDSRLTCDRLYLDFNGIIHGSAQALLARGVPCDAVTTDRVIEETLRQTRRIVARVAPTRLVYIAVDGLPPMAKLHQQRMRRYTASLRRDKLGVWDSNAVTPGTAFMDAMSAALRRSSGALSSTCDVVVSDADEEGEGEQKIFKQLRRLGPGAAQRCVVYGLDADLLLMALLSPARDSLRVLRESSLDQDSVLQCVDVRALSRSLSAAVAHPTDGMLPSELRRASDEEVLSTRMRDFVVLCMLLGNDFVPSLPSLRIRDGAPDALLRAYRSALDGSDGRRISRGGPASLAGIDASLLAAVVRSVAQSEDAALRELDERYYRRVESSTSRARLRPADLLDQYPVERESAAPNVVRPGAPGWRYRYYAHLFGFSQAQARHVHAASLSFVAGLAWSVSYMEQSLMSTGYYYPHEYAPLAQDVHNALLDAETGRSVRAALVGKDLPRPPSDVASPGEWQLLLVLPRASGCLLPDRLRAVMERPELGCTHMFPVAWKYATYLKDRLHEAPPRLPPLDVALLLRACKLLP
jgi:5'-3' exonuclease